MFYRFQKDAAVRIAAIAATMIDAISRACLKKDVPAAYAAFPLALSRSAHECPSNCAFFLHIYSALHRMSETAHFARWRIKMLPAIELAEVV